MIRLIIKKSCYFRPLKFSKKIVSSKIPIKVSFLLQFCVEQYINLDNKLRCAFLCKIFLVKPRICLLEKILGKCARKILAHTHTHTQIYRELKKLNHFHFTENMSSIVSYPRSYCFVIRNLDHIRVV